MNGYVSILSQDKRLNVCSKAQLISEKSSSEWTKPFWVLDDEDYILGKYATLERAKEILIEIHESDGKYEMPEE